MKVDLKIEVDGDSGEEFVNLRLDSWFEGQFNILEEIEPLESRVYESDQYAGLRKATNSEDFMDADVWACHLPTYQHLVVWALFYNALNGNREVVLSRVCMGELDHANVTLDVIYQMITQLADSIVFVG